MPAFVTKAADLSIDVIPSAEFIDFGQTFTYTLIVSNKTAEAATDLEAKVFFDTRTTFVEANSSGGSFDSSGILGWFSIPFLAGQSQASVDLKVKATGTGIAVFIATLPLVPEETFPADNSITIQNVIQLKNNVPPSIRILSQSEPLIAGRDYEIQFEASDPDDGVQKVELLGDGKPIKGIRQNGNTIVIPNIRPGNFTLELNASDTEQTTTAQIELEVPRTEVNNFVFPKRTESGVEAAFLGEAGKGFQILGSEDLVDWEEITRIEPSEINCGFADNAAKPLRFYKAREIP